MTDQATIHTAALLRLQIAVAALQEVSGPIAETRADLLEMVRRDPENASLAETAGRLDGLSALVSAALEIAWGGRTEIPEPLHPTALMPPEDAERILQLVRS